MTRKTAYRTLAATAAASLLVATALLAFNGRLFAAKPAPPPPPTPPPTQYELTLIGMLPGGTYSFARDINNHGVVVGFSDNRAIIWIAETGIVNLNDWKDPADPNAKWILLDAFAVNDNGQVVGYARLVEEGVTSFRPYRFTPAGTDPTGAPIPAKVEILTVYDFPGTVRMAINELGDAAGKPLTPTGEYASEYAFIWSADGTVIDLGTPYATGINDDLQVCGNGPNRALRWDPTTDTWQDLGVIGANPPSSAASDAWGINASGEVTGRAYVGKSRNYIVNHAFRYTDGVGMKDLGALTYISNKSLGLAINSRGDVAGVAGEDRPGHLFLYVDEKGMTDLEVGIVNRPAGLELQPGYFGSAFLMLAINDARELCGTSFEPVANKREGYVLTPILP